LAAHLKNFVSEMAWFFCQLIYRFYGIILSAIFSYVFYQSLLTTLILILMGVTVDAWRFRPFLRLPSDRVVRSTGLRLSIVIAVLFGALVAWRPSVFGFLIEQSYGNYQMILKLTNDELRAGAILFVEVTVVTFGVLFIHVQLLAHERSAFIATQDKWGPLRMLGSLLMAPAILLLAIMFQVEEPNPRRTHMYVPHQNIIQLAIIMAGIMNIPFLLKYILATYRTVAFHRSSANR
jgi:hypothetical protein